jgi:hypothetical protein
MKTTFTEALDRYNTVSIIAASWGMLLGSAVTLSLTAVCVALLGGGAIAVTICCSVVALLSLLGFIIIILAEWVEPGIKDGRAFIQVFKRTILWSVFMPVLVLGGAFFLLTLKPFLRIYMGLFTIVQARQNIRAIFAQTAVHLRKA